MPWHPTPYRDLDQDGFLVGCASHRLPGPVWIEVAHARGNDELFLTPRPMLADHLQAHLAYDEWTTAEIVELLAEGYRHGCTAFHAERGRRSRMIGIEFGVGGHFVSFDERWRDLLLMRTVREPL